MMSNKEELNALKEEYTALHHKLEKLSKDELKQVTEGKVANGTYDMVCPVCGKAVDLLDLRSHYLMCHFETEK